MALVTRATTPLPPAEHKAEAVEAMFDRIAPRYDRLNRLLTFGLDVGWRRRTVRDLRLPAGSRVVDVACGTGDLCRDLLKGGYRAIGADFSAGMLASARTVAPLLRADALQLPVADGSVDGITCGFALRNFTSLDGFVAESARALRTGGRVAFVDVAEPENAILRAGHHFYFRRVVPFVGGVLSDRAAYAYLPASTAYLPGPDALLALLQEHGFVDVARVTLGLGAAQLLTGTRG
ncbi:MAG: ubiquinone/menaquinone biosynthesis methyltransferase [Actinomycetia bacterium]|nr:ubiquinone/menaquinone biosynthesis methyltransferase [Actinomycetes bacterium]